MLTTDLRYALGQLDKAICAARGPGFVAVHDAITRANDAIRRAIAEATDYDERIALLDASTADLEELFGDEIELDAEDLAAVFDVE